MEVGIITFHNHFNHGAMLQTFALSNSVQRLGHNCKIIDCNIEHGESRLSQWPRHLGAKICRLYNLFCWQANNRYVQRFHNFSQQHLPLDGTTYETFEQLMAKPPQFDAYITGSDQVWNPGLLDRSIGDAFHLCFASPDTKKLISYAPSFGVSDIPERYTAKIKNYLFRYNAISVREKRGQEIIYELTGRKADHVLDPTLLLSKNEYDLILNPPKINKDYLLVFPMETGKNQGFLHLVKEIKKRVHLPLVCVLPLNFDFRWLLVADKVILDAGPQEFLGLIKHASLICTNSFHGTVFSIIYQKNFLGFPHSTSNSRIHSLLEMLGIINRQINKLDKSTLEDVLDNAIDYDTVTPRLKDNIDRSLSYLNKALSK